MITIDASAVIRVILTEDGSAAARRAFEKITETGEPLLSPDIVFTESLNALWKHYAILKDVDMKQLESAKLSFYRIYQSMSISDQPELAEDALKIAMENRISIYDSMYVALSIRMRAPLMTFDNSLREKAERIGFELLEV